MDLEEQLTKENWSICLKHAFNRISHLDFNCNLKITERITKKFEKLC